MASYDDWNQALVSSFLKGVPRGTKIYLSVDDDWINEIGQNFSLSLVADNWTQDFRLALRQQVVIGDCIDLGSLKERTGEGIPKCVAFLGATVLAAYHMGERAVSDKNYFTQLRQVLGLPTNVSGRPNGMNEGYAAEEPLWKMWNFWLQEHGYLTSAQPGEGPKTYINYPISQSILRYTDKNKLKQLFAKNNWTQPWSKQTLMAYVRQKAKELTKHIKGLLNGSRHSYNATSSVIYELYEDWLANGLALSDQSLETSRSAVQKRSRALYTDIYRTEQYFTGEVEYYLYPKQPRRFTQEAVQVLVDNSTQALVNDRPGWYQPLSAISANELIQGARYAVRSPTHFNWLMLPQRDFWILVQDPDEESSAYAPWDSPRLGETFILLCKQELRQDLTRLRTEGLMQWNEEIEPFPNSSDWLEFHDCMILAQDWDEVIIHYQELKEALQPRDYLSINFSEGLRVPKLGGWLEGQEPLVTISGFYPQANLKIVYLTKNQQILEGTYKTNTAIPVKWAGAGDYLLISGYAGEPVERLVKIVNWETLPLEPPKYYQQLELASYQVCGSVIKTQST
ncbi:MAG: hypothetical protein F6K31_37695 [Symploca sp. SIO2G7]|nr:hypothetical protein [Symploca sp. SIO2G7]